MTALSIVFWLVLDLLFVSLVEYAAHRWLMHRDLIDAIRFPHALHHGRYYRRFNQEKDPIGRELNLRITWGDTLLACLFASPLAFISVTGYDILAALGVGHRWTWNAVHVEIHKNEGRWFASWRVYQWFRFRHFLHHRQQNRNFNVLLPIGDWLFRTTATATESDRKEWQELGAMP